MILRIQQLGERLNRAGSERLNTTHPRLECSLSSGRILGYEILVF
jgi:hypothetical protein